MATDKLIAPARSGPDKPAGEQVSSRDWWALVVILLAGFMQLLDGTIVTVATVSIQNDLNATFSQLQWVLAGYTLAFAAGLITGGRLGDVFGRRRMFVIGVLSFTGASLLCGIAPSADILVGSRVIQGIAAALMFPQVTSIIHTSFTGPSRAKAFGAFGATLGLAGLAGPVVGGAIISADLFGWDWRPIFLVNIPVGIFAAFAAMALVRESRAPNRPRLDIVGSILGTSGLVLLVYPIIQGRENDWAWWIWALMGLSVVVLGTFYLHQRARQAGGSPLVDFRLFDRSARFGVGILIVFTFFAGISSLFFVYAIFLQGGFGYSALKTGLTFMPIALASTVASGISIPLVAKVGKIVIQVGAVVMAIGIVVLMFSLSNNTGGLSVSELLPGTIIIGLGLGAAIATINNVSLAEARGPSAGSAAGVQSTMAQLGNSVGVAMLGTIFFSLLATNVTGGIAAAESQLRQDLTAASVPAPAANQIVTSLDQCLRDRAAVNDPAEVPASCQPLMQGSGGSGSPAVGAAIQNATSTVLHHDFAESLRKSLYYQLGILFITFILVFFLPRRSGDEITAAMAGGAH